MQLSDTVDRDLLPAVLSQSLEAVAQPRARVAGPFRGKWFVATNFPRAAERLRSRRHSPAGSADGFVQQPRLKGVATRTARFVPGSRTRRCVGTYPNRR